MLARFARRLAAATLLAGTFCAATAAVPAFTVQDIGSGVPIDVNAHGTILGQESFSPSAPWVLTGNTKAPLPLPAGTTSAKATRINDQGVVVGEANSQPAVWWPTPDGYDFEPLPLPAGATVGTAVDANAAGTVLLNYGTPGRLVTGYAYMVYKPYLYSRQGGLVDLSALYPLPAYPDPVDLTDGGRILLKSGDILEPMNDEPTGKVTPVPAFPNSTGGYSWTFFRASRLNDSGAFIGVATLSSSMNYAQAVKYTPDSGWKVLGGLSLNVSANGIDTRGNALIFANYVCPNNYGVAYAAAAGGTYCLDDLILGGGWSFLGYAAKGALASAIALPDGTTSSQGLIAAVGYNYDAGTSRLALIQPAGDLPLPPAPAASAFAHPATAMQPYDSITLTWNPVGELAKAYAIERQGPGETAFTKIGQVTASMTRYDDTSVSPSQTYAYRVAAVGLAGTGPYSNEVSAQAPVAKDSTPPTAIITAPADGATVSGTVTVNASFTDNVGLVYAQLSFSPTMASDIICEKYPGAPAPTLTLSCSWDAARRVAYQASSATIYASGHDALGNSVRTSVTVKVVYPAKGGGKPRK